MDAARISNTIQQTLPLTGPTTVPNAGGPVDAVGPAREGDPTLMRPAHSTNGLEVQDMDGYQLIANPDNQMVKTVETGGSEVVLVPTYRTAVVPEGKIPKTQMTAVEIHIGTDGQKTALDSVTQTPVTISEDPSTHHLLFTQFGQAFDVSPDDLQLSIDGQPVHLPSPDASTQGIVATQPQVDDSADQGVDTSVLQAFEHGATVTKKQRLADGNLQHQLDGGRVLTFNPDLRIIRRDNPDSMVQILVPGVAMGQHDGGYVLVWKPDKGLTARDAVSKQKIEAELLDTTDNAADVRFKFKSPDGRAFSLDPYHLTLTPDTPEQPLAVAHAIVNPADPTVQQRAAMEVAPNWANLIPGYPPQPLYR